MPLTCLIPLVMTAVAPKTIPLTTTKGLEMVGIASMAQTVYKGRKCVLLTQELDPVFGDMALLKGVDFKNGTIEFDVAGLRTPNCPANARSFVGIGFHISPDHQRFECFYLRMTNGRSPNQELRNHAVQYCSNPDYPWNLLREKTPFRYEAYTDLVLGDWTHVKIHIKDTVAKFFVGNAEQPTLIVNGLLRGGAGGKLALWIGGYTQGYFSNLKLTPAK